MVKIKIKFSVEAPLRQGRESVPPGEIDLVDEGRFENKVAYYPYPLPSPTRPYFSVVDKVYTVKALASLADRVSGNAI